MIPSNDIVHRAVVDSVSDGVVRILFRQAGCSACSVKSSCGLADSANKIIEIPLNDRNVRKGEEVLIHISQGSGFRAIALSYVVPFVLVMATLLILSEVGVAELVAGLVALLILIPYFILLRIFNKRLVKNIAIDFSQAYE